MHKMSKTEASIENIYKLDGRVPVVKAIPFGLQHILAMFVANIAPIIIVAAACGLDEGESAGFSLYEDDGESLGYLRDEFIRTDVSCRSLEKGFEIELGERIGKGYQVPGRRNFIFEVHTDKALRKIAIDGKTVGRTSEEKLNGESETDFSKAVSSLDRKAGRYLVRIPDDGGKHIITLYE